MMVNCRKEEVEESLGIQSVHEELVEDSRGHGSVADRSERYTVLIPGTLEDTND